MSNRTCEIDSKRINKTTTSGINFIQDNNQNELEKTKMELDSIKNQIRLVKLRQNEADAKLGFSLRGGKLNDDDYDDDQRFELESCYVSN